MKFEDLPYAYRRYCENNNIPEDVAIADYQAAEPYMKHVRMCINGGIMNTIVTNNPRPTAFVLDCLLSETCGEGATLL